MPEVRFAVFRKGLEDGALRDFRYIQERRQQRLADSSLLVNRTSGPQMCLCYWHRQSPLLSVSWAVVVQEGCGVGASDSSAGRPTEGTHATSGAVARRDGASRSGSGMRSPSRSRKAPASGGAGARPHQMGSPFLLSVSNILISRYY